ncbi:carboxypeptidase-like regulatory domain-containing protein [Hymenobacter jeollabukensis]|uniref:Carboxypeptidase regulatory-like domain-containing protein n=1 Tax=Hymenobacter jeollabukensis TaxID=2025313 RepID=A0A5R8WU28_9BACT|nr:carboxypeptidase-like regulatory domain-containing protein [Hymenobacter jeollabukensis]TLM94307.1 carboxypeptidase regulatory-like domain-containing protein [Hymenobacter jeollabukensis]
MRSSIQLLLGLCGVCSCAAPRTLPPGSYLETRSNAVLFTSRELVVYPDGHVQYLLHADDRSMAREGSGTYRLRGRHLKLHLNGQPDTARAQATGTPLPPTDQRQQFYITARAGAGPPAPLSGLTVLARNAAGAIVAAAETDSEGYAELPLVPPAAQQTIEITGVGWRRWQQPRPAEPTTFRVQMVQQPYHPYAPGTRKSFGVLARSPQQLLLRLGADTLRLVRRP